MISTYSSVIHKSRYAKYLDEEHRRESWEETVDRLMNYLGTKVTIDDPTFDSLLFAIQEHEVVPSMRLMMTAGAACDRDNISAYNCAYLAVNNKRAFSEALYILMNGE